MKKIIIALLVLISHSTMAQLSTSLSQNKPKTIIRDGNCRIQFLDSTGTQVHEMLCSQLKFWYEKSYPNFGGKKITIFDGFNKIYIENDGSLTNPTFANLDDSLNVWKQCNAATATQDYSLQIDTIINILSLINDTQYNINETFDINNSTVVFPANSIHSYTIIGITGTYDLTEVSSILSIPAGVTQTSTADGYLQNDVTVFTTGRVIIKTIR